ALLAGGLDLRVAVHHRRGLHHHVGAGDVLRPVAEEDGGAEPGETLGIGIRLEVGAGDVVALVEQHLGDAAHAAAADADEVDMADAAHLGHVVAVVQYRAHAVAPRAIRSSQSAATSRAAVVRARARPRSAMAGSRAPSRGSAAKRAAGCSGVNSRWCTNSAAPLSTSHWPLRVWWSSMAAGNGTSRAPTPAAVSSATVRAPARQTTKSAQP